MGSLDRVLGHKRGTKGAQFGGAAEGGDGATQKGSRFEVYDILVLEWVYVGRNIEV